MCRGCRLHFMLRPACLLPAARLAPPHGLLTPRSGTEVSLQYLGPATRRSDAYRDGTLTRWTGAAGSSSPSPLRVQSRLCFVTHHAGDASSAHNGTAPKTGACRPSWRVHAGFIAMSPHRTSIAANRATESPMRDLPLPTFPIAELGAPVAPGRSPHPRGSASILRWLRRCCRPTRRSSRRSRCRSNTR